MFTTSWIKDALERAIKTFCQALLAVLTMDGANVVSLDWGQALSLGGTAALVSVLTSVISAGIGSTGTASLTKAVVPNPANLT